MSQQIHKNNPQTLPTLTLPKNTLKIPQNQNKNPQAPQKVTKNSEHRHMSNTVCHKQCINIFREGLLSPIRQYFPLSTSKMQVKVIYLQLLYDVGLSSHTASRNLTSDITRSSALVTWRHQALLQKEESLVCESKLVVVPV